MATVKRPAEEAWEEPFAAEREALRRQWAQLMRRYEGQFVALYEGRVVAHGTDDEELAQQLFAKLGDVPFYIVRVEKQPTIYDLPTPEVVP
jgi:hypothetical protein